jgi:hypothetical protein
MSKVDTFNKRFPPGTLVIFSGFPGKQRPQPNENTAWRILSNATTQIGSDVGVNLYDHGGKSGVLNLYVNAITLEVSSLSLGRSGGEARKRLESKGSQLLYSQNIYMAKFELFVPRPQQSKSPPPRPQSARDPISPRVRMSVLIRDKFTCQLCGAQGGPGHSVQLEIDHIIPVAKGGTNDPENLQVLCRPCNQGKTDLGGFA